MALAVTCAVLLVVLYVVAVRTEAGQRVDNAALRGRTTDAVVQHAVDRTLDSVSVTSIFLATVALVVLALLRRRPLLAVGIGVLVLGANVTTQVLKDALTRPDLLGPETARASLATFPSGHSTVAMSLALALVLAVPARLRVPVGIAERVRGARGSGDAHGRMAPAERRARRVPRDPRLGGRRLGVARRAPRRRPRATGRERGRARSNRDRAHGARHRGRDRDGDRGRARRGARAAPGRARLRGGRLCDCGGRGVRGERARDHAQPRPLDPPASDAGW